MLGSVLRRSAFVPLLLWLLAHLALGAAIWFASEGAETTWFHLGRWLRGIQDADSWEPIDVAWSRVLRGGSGVYTEVFFGQRVKFQYPPTALTLVGGMSRQALNVLSWSATLATAVATALILRRAFVQPDATEATTGDQVALSVLCAVGVFTFYPITKAYSLGQIQTLVTALFALLVVCWQRSWPALAGAALGAMMIVKPTVAPLLMWGIIRREWRFTATAIGVTVVGLLASLTRVGVADWLDYARVLSYIGERGELFHANQSMNGLLNRLVAGGGSLTWQPGVFPEPDPAVAFGTVATAVVMLGVSLFAIPARARGSVLDLSAIALATTMSAPVAWEHHYGVVAPIVAATWPAVAAARPAGRFTGAALFGLTLVAANYFQVANRFDGTPLSPLQSYLFIAALVIWCLLLRTLRAAHP